MSEVLGQIFDTLSLFIILLFLLVKHHYYGVLINNYHSKHLSYIGYAHGINVASHHVTCAYI